ncbi:coiled-coil domain-containing protein 201, partial [Saccopteryx bilineata]|uniref:coiled-coil domain-containing protein 201 n=1 Tax=Saccopteryx bilineata TaxID=59482 RepID=UPI0033905A1B
LSIGSDPCHLCAPFPQASEWSSSEDEEVLVPKHSTPEEGSRHWRGSSLGRISYRWGRGPGEGSPLPAHSSQHLPSPEQKRRLSTIWASEESNGQLGPNTDPWAPEEEPPGPAEVSQRQRRGRRQLKEPQEESPGGWTGNVGLPGIPNPARRRQRGRRRLAAVTERVRQWEARQLLSIEKATHHELTMQDE